MALDLRSLRSVELNFDNPITESNQACRLLSLPRELRDVIWKYVLGGRRIHLFEMPNSPDTSFITRKFISPCCRATTEEQLACESRSSDIFWVGQNVSARHRLCYESGMNKWPQGPPSQRIHPWWTSHLALAFVCKQIYVEALPFAFSDNIWQITGDMIYALGSGMRLRMDDIKAIEIHKVNPDRLFWLSIFRSLQHLMLVIELMDPPGQGPLVLSRQLGMPRAPFLRFLRGLQRTTSQNSAISKVQVASYYSEPERQVPVYNTFPNLFFHARGVTIGGTALYNVFSEPIERSLMGLEIPETRSTTMYREVRAKLQEQRIPANFRYPTLVLR